MRRLPKSNHTKLTRQTDRLLAHGMVTERASSSEASNHKPWKVGEDFSCPSLLEGLKQDSLCCHENAGDMWRNILFVTERRKVKCSCMQTLSNLGFRQYLFTSIKKKQLPAIFSSFIPCFFSLAPSLFLLLTYSFSPPRNAESRRCTGTAVPRRERSFLPTRLHAVRTRNTLPFTRAYIFLSLTHKNSLARTSVLDTCSQGATITETKATMPADLSLRYRPVSVFTPPPPIPDPFRAAIGFS